MGRSSASEAGGIRSFWAPQDKEDSLAPRRAPFPLHFRVYARDPQVPEISATQGSDLEFRQRFALRQPSGVTNVPECLTARSDQDGFRNEMRGLKGGRRVASSSPFSRAPNPCRALPSRCRWGVSVRPSPSRVRPIPATDFGARPLPTLGRPHVRPAACPPGCPTTRPSARPPVNPQIRPTTHPPDRPRPPQSEFPTP